MSHGGKRQGAGRPPARSDGRTRALAVQVRCTREERDTWRAAATTEGEPLSDVARRLLDEWAESVLR